MGKIFFDPEDPNACTEFPETVLNSTKGVSAFYLANRGQCSFVQKVRNMENIGVAVGIVVDNTAENVTQVLMSDDGTGGGIRIPSMLIGAADGKKLMDWMKTATEEEKNSMAIMCEFVMPYSEDDKVSYDFWLTSSNDRALDFLEDFAGMDAVLGKNAVFAPHYVFWECPLCDERYTGQDCFGGGKYCAVEPSNMNIKGQEIIMEDLRQKCLWNNLSAKGDHTKWW